MQSPHTRLLPLLVLFVLLLLQPLSNLDAQEKVMELKSNPAVANLAAARAKSYRNPYTKLCQQPEEEGLEVTAVDKPTCKFGDGGFSVQVLAGAPPYDFYLNGSLAASGQADPNISFDNLFAGAYFVDVVDDDGFEFGLSFALDDEGADPIPPSNWRLKKAFCDVPGSIRRGVITTLRQFEVFDPSGNSQGVFGPGVVSLQLPVGVYALRAEALDGCRAFWIFDITPEITLELPYLEDFSSSLGYPDYLKWEDNYAYINRSYAIDPYTVGVATLDGFDASGQPYVQGNGPDELVDGLADKLTSRPFCLNDYSAADSIYFSFAYQPTGFGDFPNEEDALMLEFWTPIEFDSTFVDTAIVAATAITYMDGNVQETLVVANDDIIYIDDDYIIVTDDGTGEIVSFNLTDGSASVYDTVKYVFSYLTATVNDTIWNEVWRAGGLAFNQSPDFRQAILNIPDSLLYDGFRFRFANHATITGNNDHWNLDYLKMATERTFDDTLHFDVAFAGRAPSIVKRYQAMPWHQFIGHVGTSLAERADMPVCVRNLDVTANNNVSVRYTMTELCSEAVISVSTPLSPDDGVNWGQFPAGSIQCENTFFDFEEARDSFLYYRDNDVIFEGKDSVVIETEWILESTFDTDTNDYLYQQQQFFNYYAYDDGTAEAAYGLFGSGAKFAYQIVLNEPDTVRGVMVNFVNQNFQSEFLGFRLAVWDDITTNTNDDELLYESGLVTPDFLNVRDGFWTYVFDEPVAVTDTFYVGFVQSGEDLLNLGFDRNTEAQQHVLINYSGTWEPSILEGAVMLRPVVGKELPPAEQINVGIESPPRGLQEDGAALRLYPNPATDLLRFELAGGATARFVQIFDFSGKLAANLRLDGNNAVPVSNLPYGMYLIRFHDDKNGVIATGKFLKTK